MAMKQVLIIDETPLFRDYVKDITEQRGQRQTSRGRSRRRNCRGSPQLGQHCLPSCLWEQNGT